MNKLCVLFVLLTTYELVYGRPYNIISTEPLLENNVGETLDGNNATDPAWKDSKQLREGQTVDGRIGAQLAVHSYILTEAIGIPI